MSAGTMRALTTTSVVTADGPYPLDVDFTAAMDELFPSVTIELADGVADQALIVLGAGGLTTIQGIAIVSSVAISVKLGAAGSNVAFSLAAHAPLILMGTSLTAVSLSNASGETALVRYVAGGT